MDPTMCVLGNPLLLRMIVDRVRSSQEGLLDTITTCCALAAVNRTLRAEMPPLIKWLTKNDPAGLRSASNHLIGRIRSLHSAEGAVSALEFFLKLNPTITRYQVVMAEPMNTFDYASVGLIRCASTLNKDAFVELSRKAVWSLRSFEPNCFLYYRVIVEIFEHGDATFILDNIWVQGEWRRFNGRTHRNYLNPYDAVYHREKEPGKYFPKAFKVQAALLEKLKATGRTCRKIANVIGLQLVFGIAWIPTVEIDRHLQMVLDLGACEGDWEFTGQNPGTKVMAQLLVGVFKDEHAPNLIRKIHALIGESFGKALWVASMADSQYAELANYLIEARIVPGTPAQMKDLFKNPSSVVSRSRWNEVSKRAIDMRTEVFKQRRDAKSIARKARNAEREGS